MTTGVPNRLLSRSAELSKEGKHAEAIAEARKGINDFMADRFKRVKITVLHLLHLICHPLVNFNNLLLSK